MEMDKSNTNLITHLKKNPDTFGLAPSLLRILTILLHTARAFSRFCITSGQSLYAYITLSRYLKEVTISRGRPKSLNAREVTALSSSAAKLNRFLSAPFLHCTVHRCNPLRERHGTSMLYKGHRGWGRFPSSIMTTVYQTC